MQDFSTYKLEHGCCVLGFTISPKFSYTIKYVTANSLSLVAEQSRNVTFHFSTLLFLLATCHYFPLSFLFQQKFRLL